MSSVFATLSATISKKNVVTRKNDYVYYINFCFGKTQMVFVKILMILHNIACF